MAFNGSGVFSRLYNWVTEQASSPIEISKLDAQEEDIASALSNCILRDGTGVPTSATPWNSQNLTGVGSLTAVSGTFSSSITATALIPSSSSVPANGVYLPAANTVGVASNTTLRVSVNSTGNWTFAAPSSGTALQVSSASGATGINVTEASVPKISLTSSVERAFFQYTEGTSTARIDSDGILEFASNNASRVSIASAGNVTINAPSSGNSLSVNTIAGNYGLLISDGTGSMGQYTNGASSGAFGMVSNHALTFITNNSARVQIASAGNVTINAASSGDELTVTGSVVATSFAGDGSGLTSLSATQLTSGTVPDARFPATLPASSGVNLTALNASNLASGTVAAARIGSSTDYAIGDGSTVNSIQIGFRGIPQNAQTGNYTCVLADAGKHIYHAAASGAGDTYTIPANASVAYAIGTAITFINRDTTNAVSIAITTDTLTLAGTGSTGTRSLAAYGVATAIKVTSTEWMISGTGLS